MPTRPSQFLTAEWRHLAMLNFDIDPLVLLPLVPHGTELDQFDGHTIVSLVGFLFLNTRVLGMPIPFHRNFEEVNLRFYVRRHAADGWRRGVVFVRELVPRFSIAAVARTFYGENYLAVPMAHSVKDNEVSYDWTFQGVVNSLEVTMHGDPREVENGSEAEFITEHYWGYTGRANGTTMEYEVAHPRWRVRGVSQSRLVGNIAELYGDRFMLPLKAAPRSAFLAEGSKVTVFKGTRLE